MVFCGLFVFFLTFLTMVSIWISEGTSKKLKALLTPIFLVITVLLIYCGFLMRSSRGVELLGRMDLIADQVYETVDHPIEMPDHTFVLAIQDEYGDIKIYRVDEVPSWQRFVQREDRHRQMVRYEPASPK